jgi:hypothetical protein
MADVYSNVYLTIAATRAKDCGEGFLHARKAKDQRIVSFEDEQGSFDLYFYYDDLTMSPGAMGSIIDMSMHMRRVGFISMGCAQRSARRRSSPRMGTQRTTKLAKKSGKHRQRTHKNEELAIHQMD